MKKHALDFLTLFVLAALSLALAHTQLQAQSLDELAKKERERQARLKKDAAKVFTNEDLSRFKDAPVTIPARLNTPSEPVEGAEKEGKPEAEAAGRARPASPEAKGQEPEKSDEDKVTDLKGRDEAYWRSTLGEARLRVKGLSDEAKVLELRLNDLYNRFYREDSPVTRERIQVEIQKTLYEIDRNKQELAQARRALEDLEQEGRKSGALPGWLR